MLCQFCFQKMRNWFYVMSIPFSKKRNWNWNGRRCSCLLPVWHENGIASFSLSLSLAPTCITRSSKTQWENSQINWPNIRFKHSRLFWLKIIKKNLKNDFQEWFLQAKTKQRVPFKAYLPFNMLIIKLKFSN